jgi:hypothetical protein
VERGPRARRGPAERGILGRHRGCLDKRSRARRKRGKLRNVDGQTGTSTTVANRRPRSPDRFRCRWMDNRIGALLDPPPPKFRVAVLCAGPP